MNNLNEKETYETYYCTKDWINPQDSRSTSSVVCYDGIAEFYDGLGPNLWIEIADCHQKVRIHKCSYDSVTDYINKISKLKENIDKYHTYLIERYKDKNSKFDTDIHLCQLLKNHVGEKFYSPIWGECELYKVNERTIEVIDRIDGQTHTIYDECYYIFGGELALYPNKYLKNWDLWQTNN